MMGALLESSEGARGRRRRMRLAQLRLNASNAVEVAGAAGRSCGCLVRLPPIQLPFLARFSGYGPPRSPSSCSPGERRAGQVQVRVGGSARPKGLDLDTGTQRRRQNQSPC